MYNTLKILTIASLIFIASCTTWEPCKDNGGLKNITPSWGSFHKVECNDGTSREI